MTQVIAIHGHARVGKDTAAHYFVEQGFVQLAFADALRDVLYDMNPLVGYGASETLNLRWIIQEHGWDRAKELYPTVRSYLQDLGHAVRRHLGVDTWIKALRAKIALYDKVVVSDVRYPNELSFLQDWYETIAIKITRPGVGPVSPHPSDAGLPDKAFNYVLVNGSTIEGLHEMLAFVLEYMDD